jgi:type I restriction enzyme M protein
MQIPLLEDTITPALAKEKLRDLRNYLAGRTVGITKDESLLEEVIKIIFCLSRMKNISIENAEEASLKFRQVFAKIKTEYPDIYDTDSELLLGPSQIYFSFKTIQSLNIFDKRYDLLRDVYETFIGSGYRGQEGQFFTPQVAVQAIVQMINPQKHETLIDPACGSGSFLQSANSLSPLNIYGIDKDKDLVRLAKIHLIIYNGGHPQIYCKDSLSENVQKSIDNFPEQFDIVLANPPFGAKIVSLENAAAKSKYKLAHKWKLDKNSNRYVITDLYLDNPPPQVLFIERILSFLKPGGRAGIVLPESIISNPKHRHASQYILDNFQPLAVIGMPENLFKTSGKGGTHTKVALLILEKSNFDPKRNIFMAEAKWCGHDSRGRSILNNDLPDIISNFTKFCNSEDWKVSDLGFSIPGSNIRDSILSPGLYKRAASEIGIISSDHDYITIQQLVDLGVLEIKTGDEVGKLSYGTGDIPFIRTSDISNWEMKSDPKHGLSEDIYIKFKKKQDIRDGDILMVRDGTYLVGTCGFITKYDTKIVYQSHIYKIRLHENEYFDNFYLLAALSSNFVQDQVKSLTFTQDIINTLGKRINDLVIPVRKNKNMTIEISQIVRKSIDERVEARELARIARIMVI